MVGLASLASMLLAALSAVCFVKNQQVSAKESKVKVVKVSRQYSANQQL